MRRVSSRSGAGRQAEPETATLLMYISSNPFILLHSPWPTLRNINKAVSFYKQASELEPIVPVSTSRVIDRRRLRSRSR